MKQLFFLLAITVSLTATAQMGIGNSSPDASAQLDITSVNKGLLIPRMTAAQMGLIPSPATGLMVYQTDNNTGYYYYNSSAWIKLDANTVSAGDIKYSYQAANHTGWYLLNGQLKSSLPAAAQTAATALGIGANLPDTRDEIVKHRAVSGETIGSISGSNTITLVQTNLPNISLTTSSDGSHTHSYTDAYWTSEDQGNQGLRGSGGSQDNDNGKWNATLTTAASGTHTHAIQLNGNVTQTTVNNKQASFNLNMFIYLGY